MAGTFSDLIDAIRTEDYGEGVRQPIADALEWLLNHYVTENVFQDGHGVKYNSALDKDLTEITGDNDVVSFDFAKINRVLDVSIADTSAEGLEQLHPPYTGVLKGVLLTFAASGGSANPHREHQLFLSRTGARIFYRYTYSAEDGGSVQYVWTESWSAVSRKEDLEELMEMIGEMRNELKTISFRPGNVSVSDVPFRISEADNGLVTMPFPGPGRNWRITIAAGYKCRVLRMNADLEIVTGVWYTGAQSAEITNSSYVALVLRTDADEQPASFWDHVELSYAPVISEGYLLTLERLLREEAADRYAARELFPFRPVLRPGAWSITAPGGTQEEPIYYPPQFAKAENRLCTVEPIPGPGHNWILTVGPGYAVRVLRLNANGDFVSSGGDNWNSAGSKEITNSSYIHLIIRSEPDDGRIITAEEVWANVSCSFFGEMTEPAGLPVENAQQLVDVKNALEKKQETEVRREDNADYCGWSYWMYPQTAHLTLPRDEVFFGCVTVDGLSAVGTVSGTDPKKRSKTTFAKTGSDTHNGAAVFLNPFSDRVMAFATTHNEDRYVRMAVGNPTRQGRFSDPAIKIPFSDKVTYAQVHTDHAHDRLALFTRLHTFTWAVKFSADASENAGFGNVWEDTEQTVVSAVKNAQGDTVNLQYYCLFRETTQEDLLRIVMYSNPNQIEGRVADTNIRMGFLDLTDGTIYNANASTVLGSLATGGVAYNSFDVVVPKAAGKQNRLFDVKDGTAPGEVYIAYSDFDDGTGANQAYHVYYNGTVKDVCAAGLPVYAPSFVPGGILFHAQTPDRVFVSVCPSGSACTLDEYAYSAGAYAKAKTHATTGVSNARMRVFNPLMDPDGTLLLFNRGYMLEDRYTYYNIDVDALDPDAT